MKKESHKNSETSAKNWKMSQLSVKICQTSEKCYKLACKSDNKVTNYRKKDTKWWK